MPFEFFISRRYLKSRQKQAFISLITLLSIAGVTIGVMALIVVIAVMAGFESDMQSRILGVESHVVLMRYGEKFTDYQQVIEDIAHKEEVEAATPFIYSQIMIRSSKSQSGAILRGIDPLTAGQVIKIFDDTTLNRLSKTNAEDSDVSANNAPCVILGKELAQSLGVVDGDIVYLILPAGMMSPVGLMPAMKRFKVAGLFESGIYDFDGMLAYIHITEAQKMLRMGDSVTGIEIYLKDIYRARKVADQIVKELGFPYWAKDWTQMNQTLFSALKLEKTVMFIILTLIVLVAAFNIAGTLIMIVMEKTKDIAILKAMGATNRQIRRIFVYKGLLIGILGTVLGESLGVVLCVLLKRYKFIELPSEIYYITTLPVQLEAFYMVSIGLAAMVICYLATLYPAHQAAKLNPVEAFRYG